MTLFLTFYFPQTNRMLLGHCCMYFCLYLFLWNIIIEKKKTSVSLLCLILSKQKRGVYRHYIASLARASFRHFMLDELLS